MRSAHRCPQNRTLTRPRDLSPSRPFFSSALRALISLLETPDPEPEPEPEEEEPREEGEEAGGESAPQQQDGEAQPLQDSEAKEARRNQLPALPLWFESVLPVRPFLTRLLQPIRAQRAHHHMRAPSCSRRGKRATWYRRWKRWKVKQLLFFFFFEF